MSTYLPIKLSTPPAALIKDDPHLEVTVTPSASAFYAGETFSVTITFRNTRAPSSGITRPSIPRPLETKVPSDLRDSEKNEDQDIPRRRNQIGLDIKTRPANAKAGPSRTSSIAKTALTPTDSGAGFLYSPGANSAYRAPGWPSPHERDGISSIRSPDAWKRKEYGPLSAEGRHARRSRSLAIDKGGMSPQEMVWALGGQQSACLAPHHEASLSCYGFRSSTSAITHSTSTKNRYSIASPAFQKGLYRNHHRFSTCLLA